MGGHDSVHHGKSESRALVNVFGGEEGDEYLVHDFPFHSGTVVLHREQHLPGFDRGFHEKISPVGHRLNRVHDQVDQHLGQLGGIGGDRRFFFAKGILRLRL